MADEIEPTTAADTAAADDDAGVPAPTGSPAGDVRDTVNIDDEDVLYRRLAPHQINPDGLVNSSAFKRSGVYDSEISVDLARLTDPQTSVDRASRLSARGADRRARPRTWLRGAACADS